MDRNSILECVQLIPILDAYNTHKFVSWSIYATNSGNKFDGSLNPVVFLVCYIKLFILFYKLALNLLAPE
jgi:hypothetical protein